MATELGKAYVQIVPSAKGISGAIQGQLNPEASAAGESAGRGLGGKLVSAVKGIVATAAIGKAIGASLSAGADLQQSLGGIETLFKGSADKVKAYADEAYRTAGLSANSYMESVTSFSASLLQSVGGDTEKAAEKANMALIDMSDNSNKMGTSMHQVKLEFMKGTGAFAGTDEKNQKTFRQEYFLPYSLIRYYGIVNDRAAEITGLTEEDVSLMLKAMWNGTRNLITRTKAGQVPRVLIQAVYKTKDFYIGSLDNKISFIHDINDETIRKINDGKLQLEELKDVLLANKEHIEKVVIKIDSEVTTDIDIVEELEKAGVTVEVMD